MKAQPPRIRTELRPSSLPISQVCRNCGKPFKPDGLHRITEWEWCWLCANPEAQPSNKLLDNK